MKDKMTLKEKEEMNTLIQQMEKGDILTSGPMKKTNNTSTKIDNKLGKHINRKYNNLIITGRLDTVLKDN